MLVEIVSWRWHNWTQKWGSPNRSWLDSIQIGNHAIEKSCAWLIVCVCQCSDGSSFSFTDRMGNCVLQKRILYVGCISQVHSIIVFVLNPWQCLESTSWRIWFQACQKCLVKVGRLVGKKGCQPWLAELHLKEIIWCKCPDIEGKLKKHSTNTANCKLSVSHISVVPVTNAL